MHVELRMYIYLIYLRMYISHEGLSISISLFFVSPSRHSELCAIRDSLKEHAGGAWTERGQLTHVHVVRASRVVICIVQHGTRKTNGVTP